MAQNDVVRLSIITPVYNSPGHLADCLAAVLAQTGADTEIIVVDDASTDDTVAVAARLGVRVVGLPTNSGPAAARNYGAQHARGEVLFFVDADVVIAPGAVEKVRRTFAERPDVAALFGSYDETPRASGLVSRYRNLLHHFVHQNGSVEASTFWAGCGAIRRSVFQEIGGFDALRFPRPSIEDIELGVRLRRAGHTILLDKTLQGTHLKRWGFVSMIRTDITRRAVPWARLILEADATPATLNLAWDQRVSAALVATALVLGLLSAVATELVWGAALALVAVLMINGRLYRFFFRRGGFSLAMAGIALHLLYFVYSGLSYLFAWLESVTTATPVTRGPRSAVGIESSARGQR